MYMEPPTATSIANGVLGEWPSHARRNRLRMIQASHEPLTSLAPPQGSHLRFLIRFLQYAIPEDRTLRDHLDQARSTVEGSPVAAETLHDLEDQVERVFALACTLGDIGAQANAGEDRRQRVGRAQVDPVLLGEVVEGDEVASDAAAASVPPAPYAPLAATPPTHRACSRTPSPLATGRTRRCASPPAAAAAWAACRPCLGGGPSADVGIIFIGRETYRQSTEGRSKDEVKKDFWRIFNAAAGSARGYREALRIPFASGRTPADAADAGGLYVGRQVEARFVNMPADWTALRFGPSTKGRV